MARRYLGSLVILPLLVGLGACSEPGEAGPGEASGGAQATGGTSSGGGAGAGMTGTGGSMTGTGGGAMGGGGGSAGAGGSIATGGAASGTGGTGGTGGDAGAPGGGTGAGGMPSQGGTAGDGPMGGSAGTAGSGGAPGGSGGTSAGSGGQTEPGGFSRPAGTIPNDPQPDSRVNVPRDQWQRGIISPSLQNGHQINQSAVVNGYMVIGGNEEFWIYDVSNPAMPRQLSALRTPNRTGGEAETHTLSFARYGDTFYMVTIGGKGIDTWDVTDPAAPRHVAQLGIPGTNYGDITEAVWGVTWQGQYIYVGATNNGIKVVDAANPAMPRIVAEVSTSQYGGFSAGPLDAIGNVLVVMTPKDSGGLATLDISDPLRPTRLASLTTSASYIGQFYRRHVYLIGVRAWDVLSNPRSISSSPLGSVSTEAAEYMAFSDDYLFLGHVRGEIGGTPGASKIDVSDVRNMRVVSRIYGRLNLADKNDDQFVFPFGNLVVIGDDQAPYPGWFVAVHATDPDTKPPVVDTVIPADQATGVSTKSRIGISFTDNIELATVNGASFIVRPLGGQPLPGKYGVRTGVLNFDPDQDLEPGTTYEVILPAGGITDLVGNALATEFKSTFTTN